MNLSMMMVLVHYYSAYSYLLLANLVTMDVVNCCTECPFGGDMMTAASKIQ